MVSRSRTGRQIFALIGLGALLVGVSMFFFPYSLATLPAAPSRPWPWPIGPQAVRFFASALIAIALSTGLVALRPDRPSILAYATLMLTTGTWLILYCVANLEQIDWSKPLAFVWVIAVAAVWLVALTVVGWLWRREARSAPPLPPTPRIAAQVALLIGILTGAVGVTMFFFPASGASAGPGTWEIV
jgi:hypothetical protein